ncbi:MULTISPECIES: chain-length determining protein [Brevundimonas]|uniref:Chain-length determining protein n=1 Tax=Brevundimonas naejangsanensis TaxID=588932 RepID=A0A172Y279_9CAUL|nr:chain-length determining protein [Brevundimonas naejangsanensis]ANF53317.1 chain-length determining protein [Brevundimonas naejangsanensis]QBQ48977.1 chain-length determining protein [Brevundimonas naejangsanensis]
MAEQKISYVGPLNAIEGPSNKRQDLWKRIPVGFLIVVALPTLIAMIYYLLIASPRYVSEARFVVRSANSGQPSAVGLALQGVGFSTGMNDAFAVHEYISSRDGLKELQQTFDLNKVFARPGSDFIARYPRPWESRSEESLYKAFLRFMTVGYDSGTGISTLRVEAFDPKDAQNLNKAMLASGETLINRLNERASNNAVRDAKAALQRAQGEVAASQQALTALRNSAQFIDPRLAAAESSGVINGLLVTIAQLRAERAQVAAEAPASPQLPILDNRIAAYERQVAEARAKMAGDASSLSNKIGPFEELTLRREIADKQLTQATAALLAAEQEAGRQKLYLERIVEPSLPDKASEPRRWRSILTILASTLLAYGVGWLVWAGVREHRQQD